MQDIKCILWMNLERVVDVVIVRAMMEYVKPLENVKIQDLGETVVF